MSFYSFSLLANIECFTGDNSCLFDSTHSPATKILSMTFYCLNLTILNPAMTFDSIFIAIDLKIVLTIVLKALLDIINDFLLITLYFKYIIARSAYNFIR